MKPDTRPYRIGVLADRRTGSGYLQGVLTALHAQPGVEVALLWLGEGLVTRPHRSTATRLAAMIASRYAHVERGLLTLTGRMSASIARRASSIRTGRPRRACHSSTAIELRSQADVAAALADLDLVVSIGFPKSERLAEFYALKPVIRIDLTAEASAFPQLVGLKEVVMRHDRTEILLRRYRAGAKQPIRLVRCKNRTRPLLALNQAASWGRAISLVLTEVEHARKDDPADTDTSPDPASQPSQPDPTERDTGHLGAALRYPFAAAATALGSVSAFRRKWYVAIGQRDAQEWSSPRSCSLLEPPPGMWVADPMLYRDRGTGQVVCFVEEFGTLAGRAHIAAYAMHDGSWRRLGVAVAESFHLSFPFVFEHAGALYMCPEMSGSNTIALYRCTEFPLKWVKDRILMRDVSAADTMLFAHQGLWWMLTNIDRSDTPDHQSELHVFNADSPLSDEWRPHPQTPVHLDCHGARNGGLVINASGIHRIGQCQSFSMYGHKLHVYRIDDLSSTSFRETLVAEIMPPAESGAIGTHTYSAAGDLVAIDILMAG